MTSVPSSRSQKARRSVLEMSAVLPTEANDDNPRPRSFAASMTAIPSAPLCDMKATRPGGAWTGPRLALRPTAGSVFITPTQLGPTSRMPAARQMRISSRWRLRPRAPASSNPAETTTSARTSLAAQSRATARTASAGTATTARSRSPGTSRTERCKTRSSTCPPRVLTACTSPVKPAASTWRRIAPPTDPARAEAPTTAIARGRRTLATAAVAATASRSSYRRCASASSSVGISMMTASGSARTLTVKPLSRNTWTMRWFSGRTSA